MLQGIRQIGTLRLRLPSLLADEPNAEWNEVLVADPLLPTVVHSMKAAAGRLWALTLSMVP